MPQQVQQQIRASDVAWPGDYVLNLIHSICCLAGSPSLLDDVRANLRAHGVLEAIDTHHPAALFEWLITSLSYQGIADGVAADYMTRHGRVTWRDIAASLKQKPACPKLHSYWHFFGCRFRKASFTCAEPQAPCKLPVTASSPAQRAEGLSGDDTDAPAGMARHETRLRKTFSTTRY